MKNIEKYPYRNKTTEELKFLKAVTTNIPIELYERYKEISISSNKTIGGVVREILENKSSKTSTMKVSDNLKMLKLSREIYKSLNFLTNKLNRLSQLGLLDTEHSIHYLRVLNHIENQQQTFLDIFFKKEITSETILKENEEETEQE